MTNRISRSAKLLFTSALLALSLGACAADPDLDPATTTDDSQLVSREAQADEVAPAADVAAQAASEKPLCCSSGGYTCPTNSNVDYDYDPPGCGALTRPRAQSLCNAHCSVACRDSGWIDTCN